MPPNVSMFASKRAGVFSGRPGTIEDATLLASLPERSRYGVRRCNPLLEPICQLSLTRREFPPTTRRGKGKYHRSVQRRIHELEECLGLGIIQFPTTELDRCRIQRFHHRPFPWHALLRDRRASKRLAQPIL